MNSSSFRSENKVIWSRRRLIKSQLELSSSSGEYDTSALKLDVVHPVSVAIEDAVNHRAYWLRRCPEV